MRALQRTRLNYLFQSLAVLGATVPAYAACSSGSSSTNAGDLDGGVDVMGDGSTKPQEGDASISRVGFDQSPCSDAGAYEQLVGVTATPAVDYLAIRNTYQDPASDAGVRGMDQTGAKSGTACATATNQSTCTSALAALAPTTAWKPSSGGGQIETWAYLAYTRGDQVAAITTKDAVAAFIAPVENVKDAAFIATLNDYAVSCRGGASVRATASGWEMIVDTGTPCSDGVGGPPRQHRVAISTAGALTVIETIDPGVPQRVCGIGRRPEGLCAPEIAACTEAGAYFARMAHLEAASVPAFERLTRELLAHGAPRSLVERSERAREDEVRHARMTATLAQRHGGTVQAPRVGGLACRSLFEMAVDNAVEGCVSETFGALLVHVQAARVTDSATRRMLEAIAKDETEHAELSWDIAAWVEPHLTEVERERICEARASAVAELREIYAQNPDPSVAEAAGLPEPIAAIAMLDGLEEALWRDVLRAA